MLCKYGRVLFFNILLTIWNTFGKLLGAAGGLVQVVGTAWGGLAKKEETMRVSRRSPKAPRLWATFDSLFDASGCPLDDTFHCYSDSCFGLCVNGFLNHLGIIFSISFVTFLIFLNKISKQADLCK